MFHGKKCTLWGTQVGSPRLYTCSIFPLEIIFDAKSTVYVQTAFCQLSGLETTKAALEKNGLNRPRIIYTKVKRTYFTEITTQRSQTESLRVWDERRLQLKEKGVVCRDRESWPTVQWLPCVCVCVSACVCVNCGGVDAVETCLSANVASV